jgi:hypothetical protein
MTHSDTNSIVEILDEFLDEDQARELAARLEHEIGGKTDSKSLKYLLYRLNLAYSERPLRAEQLKRCLLYALIVFHLFVVFVNIAAFFITPFLCPIWVWMPINSFIITVTFTRQVCPLTKLENYLRTSIGMPRIGGFVGHYIVRPVKKIYIAYKRASKG